MSIEEGSHTGRRNFLKTATASAAALGVAGLMPSLAEAKPTLPAGPISLEECVNLTPGEMARKSAMVKTGYDYLIKSCGMIGNASWRQFALECLKNPTPKIMALYPTDVEKEAVKKELVAAGYLKSDTTYEQFLPRCAGPDRNVQSFAEAPGSGWKSHHAYPGGLVTHVAVFLKTALGIYDAYEQFYGYRMNRDLIVAAAMIHDAQKPWVFQWNADASCFPESPIAGTGSHHTLSLADAIHRKLPAELIVSIACCHMHPGFPAQEAEVVGWLKAASIMNGVDPVRLGLLAADGKTLPLPRRQEGFIAHLGDHDYVLTSPAAQWMVTKLTSIARVEYGMSDKDLEGKPFNSFRNYLFSQASVKRLHQIWVERGDDALVASVKSLVRA